MIVLKYVSALCWSERPRAPQAFPFSHDQLRIDGWTHSFDGACLIVLKYVSALCWSERPRAPQASSCSHDQLRIDGLTIDGWTHSMVAHNLLCLVVHNSTCSPIDVCVLTN